MHHLANLAALHDEGGLNSFLYRDEIMMHRTYRQQTWNGCTLFVDVAVAEDDVIHPFVH